jgi:hypothetical protein
MVPVSPTATRVSVPAVIALSVFPCGKGLLHCQLPRESAWTGEEKEKKKTADQTK